MVVAMSFGFTKKWKQLTVKNLIITYMYVFFVNLLLTFTNEPANQLVIITIYFWAKPVNLLMVYI